MQKYIKVMDNIGDWLYYIIILAVAGISWVSNLNKKKHQEAESPIPAAPREMHVPPPPAPSRTRKKPPVPRHAEQPSKPSFLTANEGERAIKTEWSSEEEKEVVLAEELNLTDIDTFRKAIIYAEILNRKYC
jgi:hypothetical protein